MANISINDITTGEVNGDGVFDKLMQSIQARLDEQFKANRLKGPDYAQVYLGAMDAAMQQSIAFVLGEQQADKQAELIAAQVITQAKQDALIEAQINATQVDSSIKQAQSDKDLLVKDEQIETANKEQILLDTEEQAKQYEVDNLLPEQLIKIQEEIDILQSQDLEILASTTRADSLNAAQIAKINDEENLVEQQVLQITEQRPELLIKIQEEIDLLQTQDSELSQNGISERALRSQQVSNLATENTNLSKQGLILDEQRTEIQEKVDLLQSQDLEVIAGTTRADNESTAKISLVNNQAATELKKAANVEANTTLLGSQSTKTIAESNLTDQRKLSEIQNTSLITNKVVTENKQLDLLDAQITKTETDNIFTLQRTATESRQTDLIKAKVEHTEEEVLLSQANRQIKENDLIKSTLESVEYPTTIINTRNKALGEIDLLGSQKLKVDKDIILTQSNIDLTDQKELTEAQVTALTTQKIYTERANVRDDLTLDTAPTVLGGLLSKQASKIVEENKLIEQKVNTEEQQQILLHTQNQKTLNEKDLLKQKEITEWAQTELTTKSGTIGGVSGAQEALYGAQKDGFSRDAEQKAAKILADIFAVVTSTESSVPTVVTDANITTYINKLLENANLKI